MGKLNNELARHVDRVLEVLVHNATERNMDLNQDLLQHVKKTILKDNYTLYATGNFGGPTLPKPPKEDKKDAQKTKFGWKFYKDDKSYSLTKDIEENVVYIRVNKSGKVIGTISTEGIHKLTADQVHLLNKLGLKYDEKYIDSL